MRKTVIATATLCILLNGLLSVGERGAFSPGGPAVSSQIQSPIFQFSSLLRSGALAASGLVREGIPLFPEFRGAPDNEPAGENTSSKYGITVRSGSATIVKCGLSGVFQWTGHSAAALSVSVFQAAHPPGAPPLIVLLFLMYFVILGRSNLPDPAMVFCLLEGKPGCSNSRVFHLQGAVFVGAGFIRSAAVQGSGKKLCV